jgi:hypothetical protein
MELYDAGVDYVIMPHQIGGHYVASFIEKGLPDRKMLAQIKKEQLFEMAFEANK